ncbi:KH domain-containing protein [Indiicoccus explosivorum]|uniref:KH domain-containing protein n=1 Tax=Indiicoccus explosivorum TaxID=1917864 RepID=UPI000B4451C9|nr:KH domain-containing protein [Indiicoccus explosivorum]
MKKLIETMVKPLVDHPEDVRIETEESGNRVVCNLTVHPQDIGKVIGKQGRTAKAIRSIVYSAAGSQQDGKTIVVNIVD